MPANQNLPDVRSFTIAWGASVREFHELLGFGMYVSPITFERDGESVFYDAYFCPKLASGIPDFANIGEIEDWKKGVLASVQTWWQVRYIGPAGKELLSKLSPAPYADETGSYSTLSGPTECDFCLQQQHDVIIDGATIHGYWAKMCESCHATHGLGLGTGKGQKFDLPSGTKIAG